MPVEKVIASYIVRFSQAQEKKYINVHDLRTGERLTFETWVSAWVFLEAVLEKSSRRMIVEKPP